MVYPINVKSPELIEPIVVFILFILNMVFLSSLDPDGRDMQKTTQKDSKLMKTYVHNVILVFPLYEYAPDLPAFDC